MKMKMKMKNTLILGAMFAGFSTLAQAQVVINITGATAFRDAADSSIIAFLGGDGVAERARTDMAIPPSTSPSNFRLYRGTVGSTEYVIRATYSGSTKGILDVADQNDLPFLLDTVPTTTTGTGAFAGVFANDTEIAKPRFSFSDVDQLLSQRPNAPLGGGPVGVVPFMFVAGESAPAGVTNMTDQLHNTHWKIGAMPASLYTGDPADATFLMFATGRSNGSGTRATILAETQYGAFTNVAQFNSTFTGDAATGSLTGSPSLFPDVLGLGNGGHTSNSGVRNMLNRTSNPGYLGGNYALISYLTVSDAIGATGYDPLTGNVSGGEGAKPLTYNGVRYSVENVQSGAYSLWGYQQLYIADGATQGELDFFDLLAAEIPGNMGDAGIPIPSLAVERVGGDGGSIVPTEE
jgi:hypothetical protein